MIPITTTPLVKSIRTLEGILVLLTNIGLTAGTIIEPDKLPPKEAAIVIAALTGLHSFSRSLLKGIAALKTFGIEPANYERDPQAGAGGE